MSAQTSTLQNGSSNGPASKPVKWLVAGIELALVVLIAYQLAQFVFARLDEKSALGLPIVASETYAADSIDASELVSFDPFFRTLAQPETVSTVTNDIPESSLRIEVFGLRAVGDGGGSAIVKMQDGEQKLVVVGEDIASGIRLVGVYADRLEISRGGTREAVYLRPQANRITRRATSLSQARTRPVASTKASPQTEAILAQLKALQLSPVRRQRRIVGFRLPEALPPSAQLMGLEGEDILLSVNGEPLTSFERLEELEEELSEAGQLTLEIERRGEVRRLSLSLRGN